MSSEWKNWCRLCGCKNNSDVDIFIKNENFCSLSEAIQRYLSITICDVDEAPKKICMECQTLISEFLTFAVKATKIQEMYSELQFNDKFEMLTNFDKLREKYGLSIEPNENFTNCKSIGKHSCDEADQEQPKKRKRMKRTSKIVINSEERESESTDDETKKIIYDTQSNGLEDSLSEVFYGVNQEINVNVEIREDQLFELSTSDKLKKKSKIKSKTHSKKYKLLCKICDRSFANQAGYTTHQKLIHKITRKTETYPCEICGKVYRKSRQLKIHENTHLPPDQKKLYSCPHCDKKFTVETSIARHILAVHTKEKCFVCEKCGKAFPTSSRLASHKITHRDGKLFQCSECSKSFKCSKSLKIHIDSHDDTKYICPICGTQLNTKGILRTHMIIHSDEKKYKCNFCDKDFKRSKAFKNHLILHTGLKPYHCQFCDQTFANGSNCRKHQKTTHPKELAEAEKAGPIHITRNIPSMQLLKTVNEEAILNNKNSTLN